jgi:hypothetical protein
VSAAKKLAHVAAAGRRAWQVVKSAVREDWAELAAFRTAFAAKLLAWHGSGNHGEPPARAEVRHHGPGDAEITYPGPGASDFASPFGAGGWRAVAPGQQGAAPPAEDSGEPFYVNKIKFK